MKKFQRSDIVGIERENARDETYRSKTNPQIDGERTRFNHHFISPNGSYTAFINRRLKELAPKRTLLAEQNASNAEQRQAHAEERTADLFKQQERLEREVSPLQAAR